MAFNAKEYRQALEKPTYIDEDENGNEVVFTGEVVSFNTVAEFTPFFAEIENKTENELRAIIPQLVAAIKMPPEAAEYINRLPVGGILEVVANFFECLKGIRKS